MNDIVTDKLSVLLPSSKIDVFSVYEDTRNAVLKLKDDWRFARVDIQLYDGDVSTAKELYKNKPSPELLLLETKTIEDEFVNSLEELAEYCNEGTSAMVIGPVNDISLYRKLVGMGISDYLVRPVGGDDLSNIIAKSLIDRIGLSQSNLICVIGAKGGVGVSSISYALAEGISKDIGQKTMAMDCCGGWSYLARAIGGQEPTTTLSEACKMVIKDDEEALQRLIAKVSENLSYLATGVDDLLDSEVSVQDFEMLIDKLMSKYPVLCIDLSMSPSYLKKLLLKKANRIILVTNGSLPSLRSCRTLINDISTLRGGEGNDIRLVVNMKGFLAGDDIQKSDIESSLDFKISLMLDYEPKIWGRAESKGINLSEVKGGAFVLNQVTSLVSNMFEHKKENFKQSKGGLTSFLDIFKNS